MKKLIAYDLDGTLADTRHDIVLGVNHMLAKMEAPALSAEEISGYVGKGLHDLVRSALKTCDQKEIEKGAKLFRSYYEKHMMEHTVLYKGVSEMLDYFRARKQIVLTNKPSPFSEKMIAALGVAGFFTAVITGNPGRPKKPDPALFLDLLELEGISPAEALLIGDSEIDIETGRRAGCETLVVSQGFSDEASLERASPDYLVHNFSEALALAKQKGW